MKLNELKPSKGSRAKAFRKGRGAGSGAGKTAGRGHDGQKSRAGSGGRLAFEGGQMPLYRRIPKRGFNNKRFMKRYVLLNVGELNQFAEGSTVDLLSVLEAGLVKSSKRNDGLKILGDGDIEKSLVVKAAAFTNTAREKIEKAGGTVEEV